jgi:hypothetical protein
MVAYFLIALCAGIGWLADKAWPDATWGNCFSYSLHRWCQRRGVLALTFVEDARLLWIFPVIHATLTPGVHRRAAIEMTSPVDRKRTRWLPWWAWYFHFKVIKREPETKHGDL